MMSPSGKQSLITSESTVFTMCYSAYMEKTNPADIEPDTVNHVLQKTLKITLGIAIGLLVMLLLGKVVTPPTSYTGEGTIVAAGPTSTGCILTVKPDNGSEYTYVKSTPYCFGYSVGKRVQITKGQAD